MIRVNGVDTALGDIETLGAFLEREGYPTDRIAVEKNGAIVPKKRFDAEPLREGDRLEIVAFVGGG